MEGCVKKEASQMLTEYIYLKVRSPQSPTLLGVMFRSCCEWLHHMSVCPCLEEDAEHRTASGQGDITIHVSQDYAIAAEDPHILPERQHDIVLSVGVKGIRPPNDVKVATQETSFARVHAFVMK